MGIFSALRGAPYDSLVELATSEANTSINWSQISSLCEAVNEDPKGAKSAFGSILRRLRSPIPIVQMQCLQLIDSAIHDCGKPFHLQVCSRDFVNVLLRLAGSKVHAKVSERARLLIRAWADQFRADPQLSLMCSLYEKLKAEGAYLLLNPKKEVKPRNELKHPSGYGKAVDTKQEETINLQDALLEEHQVMKAIELSLGEQHAKQQAAQGAKDTLVGVPLTSQASSLYPTLTNEKSAKPSTEPLKVRALYDFEAAEVNELTFKAGELLLVSDSSNVNWWSGSNHRGQGLFPASFVTTDLAAKHEQSVQVKETSKKKVHFNEQIELLREKSQDVKAGAIEPTLEIDESRLDRLLHLLAEANPKQADSEELLDLEEKCISMLPLINAKMEVTDKRNVSLSELSGQLAVALNLYHDLMKDSLLMQGQATLASSDPFGAMSLKAGGQPSESYVHPRLSGYISQPPPYCPGQMTGHFGQRAPRSTANVAPAGQYFAPSQEQLNAGYSKLYQMPDGMSLHSHGPFSKVNHLGEPKLAYSMAGPRRSQPHEALNGPPQAHPRMMAPFGQYPQGSVSFSQSTGHTRPRNNSPFEPIYSHTDHRQQQQQPSNRYLAPTPQASQQHQVGPHNYAPVYHHQGWLPVYPGAPLSVPNQPYARPRTQLIHEPGMYLNLPSASSNPHAYSAMPRSHGTNGNLTRK